MTVTLTRFLIENRIEYLKQQHAKGIDTSHDEYAIHSKPNDIIDHFAQHADPTSNKEYTQWVVNQYKAKHIRQEDVERVNAALSTFHTHKNRLNNKDINSYKHITDVESAVEPYKAAPATNRERAQKEVEDGLKVLYKDDKIQVNHLLTPEASMRLYGGGANSGKKYGTNWCTAANQAHFKHYASRGDLYTIHADNDPRSPYQLHNTSGQTMDRFDKPISPDALLNKYPQLSKPFAQVHPSFDVDGEHLDKFLLSKHTSIRKHVYSHPKAGEDLVERGAFDPNKDVRVAALKNPNLSGAKLHEYANDRSFALRTPTEQNAIKGHPNYIQHFVERTPDLLDIITSPLEGGIPLAKRAKLLSDPKLSTETLTHLTNNIDKWKRHRVTWDSPLSTQDVGYKIYTHPNANESIRKTILSHPDTVASSSVLSKIIKHKSTTSDLVIAAAHSLKGKSSDAVRDLHSKFVNSVLASSTDPATIEGLTDRDNFWNHHSVLSNPHVDYPTVASAISRAVQTAHKVDVRDVDNPNYIIPKGSLFVRILDGLRRDHIRDLQGDIHTTSKLVSLLPHDEQEYQQQKGLAGFGGTSNLRDFKEHGLPNRYVGFNGHVDVARLQFVRNYINAPDVVELSKHYKQTKGV